MILDQELLASEVASQVAAHEKYGGIVPEIASRNHLIYAPRLLDRAINAAKIGLSEVDAFAATSGPGLASSLMIGASIAKGLAVGFVKPYLAINHLEGHLLSPFFGKNGESEIRPNVSLIVSGGHTMLDSSLATWRTINLSAARWMMLQARRSIKWPRCSGSVIPAGRKLKSTRAAAIRGVLIFRAACSTRRISASAD